MRFLVLHGYAQNAKRMSAAMLPLVQRMSKRGVEFEFMTAPFPASARPQLADLRCWWLWDKTVDGAFDVLNTKRYTTLLQSQAHVAHVWREASETGRPYQGLFGFSQGAALACTMGPLQLPGLRARVLVASPRLSCPVAHAHASTIATATVATLRVACSSDQVITLQDALTSVSVGIVPDPTFVAHNDDDDDDTGGKSSRGHGVPSSALFAATLTQFVRTFA